MPAERTRGSRRAASDGDNLVWTEPSTGPETGIAFATTLTPSTFIDTPPPPAPQSFFVFDPSPAPSPSASAEKRPHRKRVQSSPSPNEPHVSRPPNAFILFRSSFVKARAVSATLEPSHAALSAIAGHAWSQMPPTQKAEWFALAKAHKEQHALDFPHYSFRPQRVVSDGESDGGKGVGGGGRKRKKKASERDLQPSERRRAEHIASLLLKGLRGEELEQAQAVYDAQHADQLDVRFSTVETPEARRRAVSESQPKKRTTAKSAKRKSSSPTPTPAPSPFEFTLDFDCASPIDSYPSSPSTSQGPFAWPSQAALPTELDFSSNFGFDSFDSLPSTAPASPALSYASTSSYCSSLASLSPSGSCDDFAAFFTSASPELDLNAVDLSLRGLDLSTLLTSVDNGCIAPSQTMHAPTADYSALVGEGQW